MPDIHFSQAEINTNVNSQGILHSANTNTIKSQRMLATANSTMDVSTALKNHKTTDSLPKLKEVWRFIKSLLSNFVQAQSKSNYLEEVLSDFLSLLNA